MAQQISNSVYECSGFERLDISRKFSACILRNSQGSLDFTIFYLLRNCRNVGAQFDYIQRLS